MGKIADLHIHSYYSDGTMSIKEILEEAKNKNIGMLAITDHNVIDGSRELLKEDSKYNIKCISGVEIDAIYNDTDYHILGYNYDLDSKEFADFIYANNELLEEVDIKLVKKMEEDYDIISLQEYLNYKYDRRRGGFKALNYLIDKGLATNLNDVFKICDKYNHKYTCVKFPSISEVCSMIHKANGKAVLAHPGRVIPTDDIDEFKRIILDIINMGIDGIECYYPSHSKEITNICLNICREKNILITCGSDSHGNFTGEKIGIMDVSVEDISTNI